MIDNLSVNIQCHFSILLHTVHETDAICVSQSCHFLCNNTLIVLYKDEATNALEQPGSLLCYIPRNFFGINAVVTPPTAGDHATTITDYNETMKWINVTLYSTANQTVTVNVIRDHSDNSDPSLIFSVSVIARQATTGKFYE